MIIVHSLRQNLGLLLLNFYQLFTPLLLQHYCPYHRSQLVPLKRINTCSTALHLHREATVLLNWSRNASKLWLNVVDEVDVGDSKMDAVMCCLHYIRRVCICKWYQRRQIRDTKNHMIFCTHILELVWLLSLVNTDTICERQINICIMRGQESVRILNFSYFYHEEDSDWQIYRRYELRSLCRSSTMKP